MQHALVPPVYERTSFVEHPGNSMPVVGEDEDMHAHQERLLLRLKSKKKERNGHNERT
jgi:hypothetical protein